jgi:thiol-disulfide isomerase/thioredoxin
VLIAARPGETDTSYPVPFVLQIKQAPSLQAALVNGADRIPFTSALQLGSVLTLRLDQYDSVLILHCTPSSATCNALEGEYVRQRGITETHYEVFAHCPTIPDTEPKNPAPSTYSIAGGWQFSFTGPDGKPDVEATVPAQFTANANHVEGTIAPIGGDYGLLSGTLAPGPDGTLHLSRFDGVHALLLDGHFVSPDRIEGIFHPSVGRPLSFIATRSAAAAGFEDAEHLTSVANPSEPFRFHAVDASGATVTQDDPLFRGKVVLLDIFGTWCPNCHDEAPVLQALYAKYHQRGLQIAGLSYEYVDNPSRSQRLIGVYRQKYSIEFPLLLAGTTDPGEVEKTMPQLRNFSAYPTTIFLDRHGKVRLVHAGFSGPATGRLEELKQNFERTIVQLLDEE